MIFLFVNFKLLKRNLAIYFICIQLNTFNNKLAYHSHSENSMNNIMPFQANNQLKQCLSQGNYLNNNNGQINIQTQSNINPQHVISKYQFSQSKISEIKHQQITQPPLPKKKKRNVKMLRHNYVCDERRQNQLNSKFLKKKQNLQNITKENKNIYKRINSQKSIYSHRSLNKSYQSNRSLMNSRATNRSNNSFNKSYKQKIISSNNKCDVNQQSNDGFKIRLQSAKLLNGKNNLNISNKSQSIGINSRNISKTSNEDIKQFACLFKISQQPKPTHIPKIRSRSAKLISTLSEAQISSTSVLKPLIETKINQIVINEQNQIQFVQQKSLKFLKSATNSKNCENNQNNRRKSCSTTISSKNIKNIQNLNLFQMKMNTKSNSFYRKLQSKLDDDQNQKPFSLKKQNDKFSQIKISKKYSGLMAKIADQLTKIKKLQPRLLEISGKGKNASSRNSKALIF